MDNAINVKRINAKRLKYETRDIFDDIMVFKTSYVITRNLREVAIMIPYSQEEHQAILDRERKKAMAK